MTDNKIVYVNVKITVMYLISWIFVFPGNLFITRAHEILLTGEARPLSRSAKSS